MRKNINSLLALIVVTASLCALPVVAHENHSQEPQPMPKKVQINAKFMKKHAEHFSDKLTGIVRTGNFSPVPTAKFPMKVVVRDQRYGVEKVNLEQSEDNLQVGFISKAQVDGIWAIIIRGEQEGPTTKVDKPSSTEAAPGIRPDAYIPQ